MRAICRSRILAWAILAVSLVAIQSTSAGPFANFFQELRNSFRDSGEQSHRTTAHKHRTKDSAQSTTAGTNNKKSDLPPSGRNTRTTSRVNGKSSSGDFKYGTPVPGKQGLVTSPYSPDAGYIDVRGFSPGTPVKDPYSGKIFLTP